jgi:uncharacterized protein YkwD
MWFSRHRPANPAAASLPARSRRRLAKKGPALLGVAVIVGAVSFSGGTAHAATSAESAAASSVFTLLNSERAANHLPPLAWSPALVSSARAHNLAMDRANLLSHQVPGEADLGTRIDRVGVPWHQVAENIGYTTNRSTAGADGLEQAMYNETAPANGHRLNILSTSVRYIGVDVYLGGNGKLWLTEDFADATGPVPVAAPAATSPQPAPGQVPGVGTTAFGHIKVFYQQANHRLTLLDGTASGWGAPLDLGGVLTSGPAAITIGSQSAATWAFVRGTNNAVWYRMFSDARGTWGPWTSLGGGALGAPATSCVGNVLTSRVAPVVWVRGTDGALWRRPLGGAWHRLGGALTSDPGALAALAGSCPASEDVFALGTDRAVWEFSGGVWRNLGGRSTVAPTAVRLPSGETDLFVRGTNNALYMNTRAPRAATWGGWHQIGGILTSAPVATIFASSPQTRAVFARGSDGNLWRGRNAVGSTAWSWTKVP